MERLTTFEPLPSHVTVSMTHRVYVLFTRQSIPVWTWLLRLGLRIYQGTWPTYTHCLLAVQDIESKAVLMYEMDFYNGMNMYMVDYDEAYFTNNVLTLHQTQFNGTVNVEEWDAVDVTMIANGVDIDYNFYQAYTKEPLTPYTLLLHITPAKYKVTWTCSGLVQVLLGQNVQQAFNTPLTPDTLHDTLYLESHDS